MAPFKRNVRDIYWMSSPLSIQKREDLADKLRESKYVPKNVRNLIDPTTDHVRGGYGFYPKIKHWTLQIGDLCYELWPKHSKDKIRGFPRLNFTSKMVYQGTDMCEPQVIDAAEWREYREKHNIKVDEKWVGQTKMTDKQIKKAYNEIWQEFNQESYEFFTQNCQNFAAMLYKWTVVDVPEAAKKSWEKMPEPAGHSLANVGRFGFAAQVGAYGLAAADAVALTVDGAAATSATTAGTATAATATTTATTTTEGVATAGTTHGTASATAAKAGGAGAGKAGLGAKLAALGHGATATKAGIALKGAAGLAMLHPVTGTVVGVTFVWVAARGARDRKWKREGGQDDSEEVDKEPSVEDMLEAENMILERAENPNAKLDTELDEALAQGMEGLELHQVTTEPGQMPESMSIVDGSPVDDSRRAQTVI